MSDLLAIDPSIRSPGAAVFRDGMLVAAARIAFPINVNLGKLARCVAAADAITGWVVSLGAKPDILVCEYPQIYSEGKGKGNPNDLIHMAGVNGCLASTFLIASYQRKTTTSFQVLSYLPAEWIGQLPKSTRGSAGASPRGKRILSRLTIDERSVLPDQHDAFDAVGIGLHALGRLGVKRALSSG